MRHISFLFSLIVLLTSCINDNNATKKVDPEIQKIVEEFLLRTKTLPLELWITYLVPINQFLLNKFPN